MLREQVHPARGADLQRMLSSDSCLPPREVDAAIRQFQFFRFGCVAPAASGKPNEPLPVRHWTGDRVPCACRTGHRGSPIGTADNRGPKGGCPKGKYPKGEHPKGNYPKGKHAKGKHPKGKRHNGKYPKGKQPKGKRPDGGYIEVKYRKGERALSGTGLRPVSRRVFRQSQLAASVYTISPRIWRGDRPWLCGA